MSWPDARLLRWTPTLTVPSTDGTGLAVEVLGDGHPGPAVVLSHGWSLSSRSWWYQRMLAERYRLVLWDQRGHGESEPGPREHRTIAQLGEDLHAVLGATCRDRDVVLVGHSMGGMTIMSLAASHPEVIGPWVRGVALVDTAAKREELGLGLPRPVARAVDRGFVRVVEAMIADPGAAAKRQRPGSRLSVALARFLNYGPGVDPRLARFAEAMTSSTPIEVVADFGATLNTHDQVAALEAFSAVPTVVVVGDRDRLTPIHQARAIAAAIPGSRLVELTGAGHSTMLERPNDVNAVLYDLVEQVAQRRAAPVLEHPTDPTPTALTELHAEAAS